MRCLSDKTTDVMSWASVKTIGGWILNPVEGFPSLATVAKLGGELASCTQTGPGIMRCLSDKATDVMSWGSVRTIGGWILNPAHGVPSLATVAKLGGELGSCTQTGPGIMRFLSDKTTNVMSWGSVAKIGNWVIDPKDGVPPLSHLNHVGDILADVLEGFGKVAASVAGQVLSGGSIGFKLHKEGGHYQSRLVTQFDGDERDTSSCLAFAPKSKHGANGQATAADWQAQNENDFVALDSWAVPCGAAWMKKNWDKWQGYSFYTAEAAIEKCV
eukprot:s1297_g11.t1